MQVYLAVLGYFSIAVLCEENEFFLHVYKVFFHIDAEHAVIAYNRTRWISGSVSGFH